ncbi:MAG: SAM-dependent methyltransferase, partial [Devosia sp.]
MAAAYEFWDKMAARYAAHPLAEESASQRKLRETRARLRPDMDLLELGCGTGSTALVHAPHVRHRRAVDC